ncbi:MAG: molybdopterin-dependent oxidoreductase [Anaerolineales bacterium]|uniref:Molybdopterin-dependent oxidoreductase n=1 Tax=Candidatus Desulfolinea nitratireducens TaxID=2841698 RepID=A0A8J6TH26_9CHLR|nr:molybdopterin-dependent oxidoreductase [Candidatus Desulfolinea nitratireducens]
MSVSAVSINSVLRSSLPKATGEAKYVSDLHIPGCLYGHVVRSPFPHARILNINVSAAKRTPGVAAVVTASDIPGSNRLGKTRFDQPILADDKVRSYLDAVVLIAAEDEAAAKEAESKIIWDFELLPPVFSIDEALAPNAPLLHADCSGNVLKEINLAKGNIEKGFLDAEVVIEDSYQTPAIEHCYFELDTGLICLEPSGIYTLWLGCHSVYAERSIVASTLDIPEEQIIVIQPYTGGSFGGKDDGLLSGYLSLLAYYAHKPVRISFSRHEEFIAHTKRHPQWIHVRMGLKKDGTLTAIKFDIKTDTGAYAHWGEGIFTFASIGASGPYRIPHQEVNTTVVYTNNIPMGAMRAWGMPGVTFAMESQLDQAAHLLSIHPLELRWKNAAVEGDTMITGESFPEGIYIKETIEAAAKRAGVSLPSTGVFS